MQYSICPLGMTAWISPRSGVECFILGAWVGDGVSRELSYPCTRSWSEGRRMQHNATVDCGAELGFAGGTESTKQEHNPNTSRRSNRANPRSRNAAAATDLEGTIVEEVCQEQDIEGRSFHICGLHGSGEKPRILESDNLDQLPVQAQPMLGFRPLYYALNRNSKKALIDSSHPKAPAYI